MMMPYKRAHAVVRSGSPVHDTLVLMGVPWDLIPKEPPRSE